MWIIPGEENVEHFKPPALSVLESYFCNKTLTKQWLCILLCLVLVCHKQDHSLQGDYNVESVEIGLW